MIHKAEYIFLKPMKLEDMRHEQKYFPILKPYTQRHSSCTVGLNFLNYIC